MSNVTTESKKRGRPAGVRNSEAVQFDIDFATKQVEKLDARLVELSAEIEATKAKLYKHSNTIQNLKSKLAA